MEPWVQSATGYIRNWIEFQVRGSQQPGCIVAIAHRGKIVTECAFGHANLATGEKLTPRHRFRIGSQGWRGRTRIRSEEHTSELQSRQYLVCRLLLEKKKKHTACVLY